MGISEGMGETFLNSLGASSGSSLPRGGLRHGEHRQGDARRPCPVLLGLGGNFLSAAPDTELTASALKSCELTTHISTKFNRSHLVTGRTALILPCLGRSEIDRQAEGPQICLSRIAQRTGHYCRNCQSHAGQALNSKLGRPDRQLCQDPRFDCPCDSRFSKISTRGFARAAFICHTLSAIAENSQTSRARRRSPRMKSKPIVSSPGNIG